MRPLQLTFAIIKPHVVKQPLVLETIRDMILTSNFKVVKTRRHAFTLKEAALFYEEHRNKFFYNRLVTFMTRYGEHKCDLWIKHPLIVGLLISTF